MLDKAQEVTQHHTGDKDERLSHAKIITGDTAAMVPRVQSSHVTGL